MANENKRIEAIYHLALEKKNKKERSAYLDSACGDDSKLRASVEGLLQAHDKAGDFLESPILGPDVTLDTSPLTEGPGTVIGRYKLLEQIGEGGFGVVYMAEQTKPINRRVALKIIKLGMDTKSVIARFEAERQALAVMDHPNIAKVFDAGTTETGRPYFVMELVRGVSISKYCDKNKLDTKERLDLFVQVCNAVQHAHQKGIIHRDIKPSNVMVTLHDSKPVPKVIDFGIAKATSHRLTEKTLFTRYAQMIGTPAYMSPEQAEFSELDIDTRTDIYSLGVLLYELLTAATPFSEEELREAGYLEMQRIIREEEPDKPSTKLSTMGEELTDIAEHRKTNPDLLQKLVRGDLDWIVMKSLEKDRTRRYETANELVADIARHLNNEPVQAAAPSVSYRLRKFVRRHRASVIAGSLVAAALLIGAIAATIGFVQARREQTKTQGALVQVEGQRRRAEGNLYLAFEALDEIYLTVVEKQLPQKALVEDADRELLQKAMVFYERFAAENKTVVESRHKVAKAYLRIAKIHDKLGQHVEYVEVLSHAIALLRELVANEPGVGQYRLDLAVALRTIAGQWWHRGQHQKAVITHNQVVDIFSKFVADFPDVPEYRDELALAYHDLSWPLRSMGRLQDGCQILRRAIEIMEELLGEQPDVVEYRSSLARYRGNIGWFIQNVQPGKAEEYYRQSLSSFENLMAEFPDVPEYKMLGSGASRRLGGFLANMGSSEEAEHALRRGIELREEVLSEFPSIFDNRCRLSQAYIALGRLLREGGRIDEAEGAERQALEIGEELVAENPSRTDFDSSPPGTFLNRLAAILERQGKAEEACQLLERHVGHQWTGLEGIAQVLYHRRFLCNSYINLARIRLSMNETGKAEKAYRSALAISEELAREFPNVPRYLSQLAFSHNSLAWYLATSPDVKLRDPASAVELAKKAVQAAPEIASFWNTLGVAHYRAGQWEDTITASGKSRELGAGGHEGIDLFFIAMGHWQLGKKDEARQWYDRGVEWMEQKQAGTNEEDNRRFRAEAAELLGISEQPNGKEVVPEKTDDGGQRTEDRRQTTDDSNE